MHEGIVVSINLPGAIGGPIKHTTKQIGTVDVSPVGSKTPEWVTRKIRHTDRKPQTCVKSLKISGEVVDFWKTNCPIFVHANVWKNLTPDQKIRVYISQLDEGYGVNYE